jgi:hypothetical protein
MEDGDCVCRLVLDSRSLKTALWMRLSMFAVNLSGNRTSVEKS